MGTLISQDDIVALNQKYVTGGAFSKQSHQDFALTKILKGNSEIEEMFRTQYKPMPPSDVKRTNRPNIFIELRIVLVGELSKITLMHWRVAADALCRTFVSTENFMIVAYSN